jgi:hypothetical protein
MATKLPPFRTGRPSAERELRNALASLDEIVETTLCDTKLVLSPEQAAELKYASDTLRPAVEQLLRYFIDPASPPEPWMASSGFEAVREIVWAAFLIGSRGTLSDAGKKIGDREHGKVMRGGNEKKKWAEALRAAVTAEVKARHPSGKFSISTESAILIQPGVRERLGLLQGDEGWPSVSTIVKHLSAMAAENN